jgi:hypothetical protein
MPQNRYPPAAPALDPEARAVVDKVAAKMHEKFGTEASGKAIRCDSLDPASTAPSPSAATPLWFNAELG